MNTWQKELFWILSFITLLVSACGEQLPPIQPGGINVDTVGSLVEVARYGNATIYDLVYSHDGKLLYLATSVGVQVLDAVTLEERGGFGTDTLVSELVISPDGRLLAARASGTITVWQLQDGDATEIYNISTAAPDLLEFRAMAFHPDTGQLWTVEGGFPDSGSTIISRRQTEQGNVVETQKINPPSAIYAFALAPRTGLVAGSLRDDDFNGDVLVWDANTGEEKHRLENHENFIGTLAFSPDERFLASASGQLSLFSKEEDRVTVWDVAAGRKTDSYDGHKSYIYAVVFDPESGNVTSADDEGRILWWEHDRGNPVSAATGSDVGVIGLALSPDGSRLVAAAKDGSIQVFTADGKELLASRENHGSGVTDLDVARDAGLFVTSHADGSLRLWEVGKNQPIAVQDKGRMDYQILTRREGIGSVAISPDASSIVAFEWKERDFLLWQRQEGEMDTLVSGPVAEEFALEEGAVFSDDGRTFAILAATGSRVSIEFWHTDQQTATFQTTEEYQEQATLPPLNLAISPDGKLFAYGLPTGDIKVRSVDGGELRYTLTSNAEPVTGIAFAPNAGKLLSATDSGTLTLWSLGDGSTLATLPDDGSRWRAVVFSPDGSLIAAASQQGVIVFYNAELNEINRLTAHSGEISGLAFAKDGDFLLSSSLDGTVRQWSLQP